MSVWDRLIGQEGAVAVMARAATAARQIVAAQEVATGAMTHAWLFTGPPGSGRSVAAQALAAALQCDDPAAPGCGACQPCRSVLAGTHPDVHAVVPEGLSISVAEMRAVVANAARLPSQGRWQVVVIEDADRLTEQASNALLKAVEEPSERTVFLLCAPSTHPDDVMVTIRSRCRHVALRTPSAASVAAVLEGDGVAGDVAAWAAQVAQGHVGRARWLARDDQARQRRGSVLAIPASLRSMQACLSAADRILTAAEEEAVSGTGRDEAELEELKVALGAGGSGKGAAATVRGSASAVKELEKRQKSRSTRIQRDALDRALTDLAGFYRDVLLVGADGAGAGAAVANPDFDDEVREVALAVGTSGALTRLEAVLACREALELNVKPRFAVEALTTALRLPA